MTYECPECDYSGDKFVFDPLDPYPQPELCPECDGHVELNEVPDQ